MESPCLALLKPCQEQPTTDDDDTPMYLQQTWSKICQALGDVFEPYLQFVMPPLFKSASIKPDINIVGMVESANRTGSQC